MMVAIGRIMPARPREFIITFAIYSGVLLLSAASAGTGNAQSTSRQPPQDPNQIEKNLDARKMEQERRKKSAVPVPRVTRPEAPANNEPLFRLNAVSVEGASVIPADAIADAYRDYLGRDVSQADLTAIAGKISDQYRDAGYHLSRAIVPPQDTKGGHLRIRVIEGKIAEVAVEGEGTEKFGTQPLLKVLIAEPVSRLGTLERQLLLVNEIPGVRIADTAIEEIGEATGRFRLIVRMKTWRVYTSLGLDNWGTPAVGRLQSYSSSAFNSYLIGGDSIGLNLATVPNEPKELRSGRLSYDAPIGPDGARLGGSASYSDVWPGDYRTELKDHTQTESYEIRGSIDPLQTRKSSLRLTAAAGLTNATERSAWGAFYNDYIRTVSLGLDYKLEDDLGGWNYLNLQVRQGLNVFGASRQGDALLSNSDASGTFSLLGLSYARYQKLTDIVSIRFAATGQVASAPLLTSQKFYLGGPLFGRGYSSGELSGDNGSAGSVELRFDHKSKVGIFEGFQLYGFFDGGAVWNYGDSRDRILSLASAGAGVRFFLADDMQADITIAAPLTYRSSLNEKREVRALFSLSKSFKFCPERENTRCF